MEVQIIAVWDIEKKRKDGCVLIDLREFDEYKKEHIPGAICITYEEETFYERIKLVYDAPGLILYCDRGNASLLVGRRLAEQGKKIYTVSGGYYAYKRVYRKERD